MMVTNKNPHALLENYSRVLLELGLVLSLFIIFQLFEIKSFTNTTKVLESGSILDKTNTPKLVEIKIEVPVQEAKPQPVVPDRILKVDDNAKIKESVILSTETDEKQAVIVSNAVSSISEVTEKEEIVEDVPFVIIEKVPIFPGCTGTNDDLRKCFSEKTTKFVLQHFNTNIATDIGLESGSIQRIFVVFKIDKNGDITNIQARAPYKKLEDEAFRVVNSLPKMTPGMQRGIPVGVSYGLPIVFKVQ